MKTKLIAVLLISVATGAAAKDYSNFVAKTKQAITRDFKDPSSAQYRNLAVYSDDGDLALCGEVNAKNSYGAYIGFTPFAASPKHINMPKGEDDTVFPILYKIRCDKRLAKVR